MDELIRLSHRLLDAVAQADWQTYQGLCSDDLTCFEPETEGKLVQGLAFHKRFFDSGGHMGPHESEVGDLHVRPLGDDAAVVCYVRTVKRGAASARFLETRVWQRTGGAWKHVHFHRSPAP